MKSVAAHISGKEKQYFGLLTNRYMTVNTKEAKRSFISPVVSDDVKIHFLNLVLRHALGSGRFRDKITEVMAFKGYFPLEATQMQRFRMLNTNHLYYEEEPPGLAIDEETENRMFICWSAYECNLYRIHLKICYRRAQESDDTLSVLPDLFDLAVAQKIYRTRNNSCLFLTRFLLHPSSTFKDQFVSLLKEIAPLSGASYDVTVKSPKLFGTMEFVHGETLISFRHNDRRVGRHDFAESILLAAVAEQAGVKIKRLMIFCLPTGSTFYMQYLPHSNEAVIRL